MTLSPYQPAQLLRAHGLHPRKAWGQSFLCNPEVARRIAEAAATPPGGTVLEIGPGLGALTLPLLERAARVVAIERDAALAAVLQELCGDRDELALVVGDATREDWLARLAGQPPPHVLTGNLPYSVTGQLLERAIGLAPHIDLGVFMMQREVAARLRAAPGTRVFGALSVFTQAAYEVQELLRVAPGSFHPVPQVDSTVVVLRPLRPAAVVETPAFRLVVKQAFAARRKMLRNAWRGLAGWAPNELEQHAAALGLALDARAETLDVATFGRMAERVQRYGTLPTSSSSSRKRR